MCACVCVELCLLVAVKSDRKPCDSKTLPRHRGLQLDTSLPLPLIPRFFTFTCPCLFLLPLLPYVFSSAKLSLSHTHTHTNSIFYYYLWKNINTLVIQFHVEEDMCMGTYSTCVEWTYLSQCIYTQGFKHIVIAWHTQTHNTLFWSCSAKQCTLPFPKVHTLQCRVYTINDVYTNRDTVKHTPTHTLGWEHGRNTNV